MIIRGARLKDLNQIYSMLNSNKEVNITKNKVYSKHFVKNTIQDPNSCLIVAEENKKIIGLLAAALWKKHGISYWDTVIVDKSFRGKGIFTKIYNYYLRILRKNKIPYFWGLVKYNNYKAQKILRKFNIKKQGLCYFYDKEVD